MITLQSRVDFFMAHAPITHDSERESEFAGKLRWSMQLAHAEAWVDSFDQLDYEWEIDGAGPTPAYDPRIPHHPLWVCMLSDGNGTCLASEGGIDLGDGEIDWCLNDGVRLYEAEVAVNALPCTPIERACPLPSYEAARKEYGGLATYRALSPKSITPETLETSRPELHGLDDILCKLLDTYCTREDLPADAPLINEKTPHRLTAPQRAWLDAYQALWDQTQGLVDL